MRLFKFVTALSLAFTASAASAEGLLIFTDRKAEQTQPALDAFQAANPGMDVTLVSAPLADLKARLDNGEKPDLLLLKDVGLIGEASAAGYYQALPESVLNAGVPAFMRDPNGTWTAISYRIRTIAIDATVKDNPKTLTYEDLASPSLGLELCMRNSADYMPALVAWLIARDGEAKATETVQGWSNNTSMFTAGDTLSLKELGKSCDATISNHYYLARLLTEDNRFPALLQMADQQRGGLHTNGFGGGIYKDAANVAGAEKFLLFILSAQGSSVLVAAPSFEFPAVPANKPEAIVQSFGSFTKSEVSWASVGANVAKAREILNSVSWPTK